MGANAAVEANAAAKAWLVRGKLSMMDRGTNWFRKASSWSDSRPWLGIIIAQVNGEERASKCIQRSDSISLIHR